MATVSRTDQVKRIPMSQVFNHFGTPCPDRQCVINSPFRSSGNEDENKSLSVFQTPNGRWYWNDHGTGEKGSSIDIAMRFKGCDFHDAVDYLLSTFSFSMSADEKTTDKSTNKVKKEGSPEQITEFSDSRALVYLMGRGIPIEIIESSGIEVKTLQVRNSKYNNLYASFPARTSRALRALDANPARWRFLGPADITLFGRQDSQHILVFESMIDALSWVVIYPEGLSKWCYVSLNSTSNTGLFLEDVNFLRGKSLWLYLDNDKPGEAATRKIIHEEFPLGFNVKDCREDFQGNKDANDFLREIFLSHKGE